MTHPFRRTRIATALAGSCARARRGARRWRRFRPPGKFRQRPRQRIRRWRGFRGRCQHRLGQSGRDVEDRHQSGGGRALPDHAVDEVQQRRIAAGCPADARWRRRRRRWPQRGAEYVRGVPDQQGVGLRHRRQRAIRPRHRVRQRLARPLPGNQIRDQDDQCQSSDLVEARRGPLDRGRRELSAGEGDVHAECQLLGRAVASRGARRHRCRDRRRSTRSPRPRRGCSRVATSTPTTGPGAGTSGSCGTSTRTTGSARTTGRPSSTTRRAPPHSATRASRAARRCQRCRRRSHRSWPAWPLRSTRGSCSTPASPRRSSCRRS